MNDDALQEFVDRARDLMGLLREARESRATAVDWNNWPRWRNIALALVDAEDALAKYDDELGEKP